MRGALSSLLLVCVCVSFSLSHTSPLQALQIWKLELQQKWLTNGGGGAAAVRQM